MPFCSFSSPTAVVCLCVFFFFFFLYIHYYYIFSAGGVSFVVPFDDDGAYVCVWQKKKNAYRSLVSEKKIHNLYEYDLFMHTIFLHQLCSYHFYHWSSRMFNLNWTDDWIWKVCADFFCCVIVIRFLVSDLSFWLNYNFLEQLTSVYDFQVIQFEWKCQKSVRCELAVNDEIRCHRNVFDLGWSNHM